PRSYPRRARVTRVAAVAPAGCGISVVPLLSAAIEIYGWRSALTMEALLIALTVIVLAVCVIRSEPDDEATRAHSENRGRPASDLVLAPASSAEPRAESRDYREIFGSGNFWSIRFALAAITAINQTLVVTLIPYATELGLSAASSALLISAVAGAAAITKVASGFLAEMVDRRWIMLAAAAAMSAALMALLTSS